jgi:hypothetical protein
LSFFAEDPVNRFDARYPAPPAVPWWVVFAALGSLNLGCRIFAPHTAWIFLPSLVMNSWAVYLALFIRRLNPKAWSIYWAFATFCSYGLIVFLSLLPQQTSLVQVGLGIWGLLSVASSIVTIYVIRYELMKHYQEVEPFGLDLGGVMTFFFAYIYFQYHLCDIAEAKQADAATLVA